MTQPILRWAVAAAATIATFTAATWICGAVVLTMHDSAVKWGIAGSVGVSLAALAALWGHSYATTEPHNRQRDAGSSSPSAHSGGETRNTILGGTFLGPVIQSRDIDTVNLNSPPSRTDPLHSHRPTSEQERHQ